MANVNIGEESGKSSRERRGGEEPLTEVPERLLEAAGPIFARDGYEGATVREICGQAGTNIASVAYYFGDKMGLYRAVICRIREARERQFPIPAADGEPQERLHRLIQTMLSRMLACDESSWQAQLMMREMQAPTGVFRELVEDYFRPLFCQLTETLERLVSDRTPLHRVEQLALSVVGQCLYYRVGSGVLPLLIPEERRVRHYTPELLSRHITAVTLSAANDLRMPKDSSVFGTWCDPDLVDPNSLPRLMTSNSDE